MYKTPKMGKSLLRVNKSKEGEPIEYKLERIISNKEPIKDGATLIYTERKEGIRASTNIRTDRWEVAAEAATKIAKSQKARREERQKLKDRPPVEKDGKPEPIQGKEGTSTQQS